MTKRKRTPTIAEFIEDANLLGPWFQGPSWDRWKSVLKAAFALPMTDTEIALFREVADRDPPTSRVRELWVVAGRRAGKDSIASAIVTFMATVPDYSGRLRPGERASCLAVACDRSQASVQSRYVRGYFDECPLLTERVVSATADGLLLDGERVEITTHANSFRSIRGRPSPIIVLTEVAYFRDENSASSDVQLYNAVLPSLVTLDGMLVAISSPWKSSGLLWDKYRRHYGKDDDDILVVKGTSRQFNETIPQAIIDQALEDDAAAASAEWLGVFRTDVCDYVSRSVIDAVVVEDRHELPPVSGVQYVAFADPSGGSVDGFTLAICHLEQGTKPILDVIRERRPPFSPEAVVEEFAATLKAYHCSRVTGDRYGGEWPRERFRVHGIEYVPSLKSKSDIYVEALPILNTGRAELLDHPRLISQLTGLTRRTARGGRESIDHNPGAFDDVANAVAGALVLAATAYVQDIEPTMPIVISVPYSSPGFSSSTRNPAVAYDSDYDRVDYWGRR